MSVEHLLSINDFNVPDSKTDMNADTLLLYNAILMRKDSHVTPGVGFEIQRYRFGELESNASKIETELKEYCGKFLPQISINEINIKSMGNMGLYFQININNTYTNTNSNLVLKFKEENNLLLANIVS